jgi:excinuclease ABC subunit B
MDETERRRLLQREYNASHGITPETVRSVISSGIMEEIAARQMVAEVAGKDNYVTEEYLEELHGEMLAAAANLEFERAAELRDRLTGLRRRIDDPEAEAASAAAERPRPQRRQRGYARRH